MKMRFGYSVDRESIVSRRICAVTGGDYAHCFVVFSEEGEKDVYFESISKTVQYRSIAGVDVWKNGVRGPVPLRNLEEWAAEKPTLRLTEISDFLPFTNEDCRDAYIKLMAACSDIHYATINCLNNWVEAKTGIYLTCNWFRNAGMHWNCSETIMRTCIPVRFWNYYRMLEIDANRIVPDGTKMISIRYCTKELMKEQK